MTVIKATIEISNRASVQYCKPTHTERFMFKQGH